MKNFLKFFTALILVLSFSYVSLAENAADPGLAKNSQSSSEGAVVNGTTSVTNGEFDGCPDCAKNAVPLTEGAIKHRAADEAQYPSTKTPGQEGTATK